MRVMVIVVMDEDEAADVKKAFPTAEDAGKVVITTDDGRPTDANPVDITRLVAAELGRFDSCAFTTDKDGNELFIETEPTECPRCGARYADDPSCGKIVHESLPERPADVPSTEQEG